MESLINSNVVVLAILTTSVAFSFFVLRYKWASWAGPALFSVIIGIILGNVGILPHWHDVYGTFFEYAIPVSLTMMLLNVNLKEWLALAKRPLLAMGFAVLSVSIVTLIASLFFASKIADGWKLAGMFIGTYTGGSSNLTAIGTGLDASPELFASANAADYVVGIPALVLFFALPGLIAKSTWFKKWWPYSLKEDNALANDENDLFAKKKWSITDVAILFAIGFGVTAISQGLAGLFPELYASALKIIFITTIAIILAQFKHIRSIPGNTDLGIFVAMFFLVIIGLTIDLKEFANSAPIIAVFCFVIILGSFLLHILLCRLFKIEYQYVLISVVAAVADGTSAAVVAGSAKWKSIIGTAIILGSIGMALGNYIGIGIAYVIRSLIGA
ncbi:DUF819 domain-containing protein [Ornithinibacillus salinisoli]|uniref:DUF819 domain-containing protein n=1 Tax=Ornithinibacillus salinisoli TaxID=1848459 RepID=A0ABW4VZW0_9BACI